MANSSLDQEQSRHYHHGQLIEFVRPVHSDGRTWKKLPAPETSSRISGNEARSFYEDLCAGDSERREKNSISTSRTTDSKRKCDFVHQRKKAKRPRLRDSCLHDIGMTERSHQRSVISSRSLDQNYNKTATPSSDSPSASGNLTCTSRRRDSSNEAVKLRASQRIRDHNQSELFRMAQNGNTESVQVILQRDVDVNCTDHFGWTATMSAAFEGHVTVVHTLVKAGADMTIRNSQGQTALSLAQKRGHGQVVQFFESFQRSGVSALRPQKKEKEYIRFYCDVCKSEFSDCDQTIHKRSTVHIFNMGQKPKDDYFLIPSSNVGYRLMMKTGWDGNRGLGPSGEGHRYPVKTLFKQDRKGLGNTVKEKAKVTHFKANDKSAVTRMQSQGDHRVVSVRTLSRRAQKAKERKDRQWEINLRHQMS